jgi:autotransporter-associated beta strand protein
MSAFVATIRCLVLPALKASLLVIVFISLSRRASATTYYWDTNGTTSGRGSVTSPANWLTNSWSTSSSGTAAVGPWPNTQPNNEDAAVFAGTAGTVRVDSNVYLESLRFETANYQLQSTGGALNFVGPDPLIDVTLSSGNVTVTAPLVGTNGLTLTGNSQSGGLKFLVLANADALNPNSFSGTFDIAMGGALRLGGGVARQQIPDNVDLEVAGVLDFITSGGASDGKLEKVRDVSVTGGLANFSIGNGSTFEVNSISASSTMGPGVAVNGNNASVPGRLNITGWADGAGNLTLNNGLVRVNTTSATSAIGGRVLLAGNILSSGTSEVSNKNGGGANPELNNFTNRAFDFTSDSHDVNVTDGTLKFTSVSVSRPLEVTSTNPGGTTIVKTGPGVWLWENAIESSFTGTNRLEEGTWRLGASERLANDAVLEVAGGFFDLQGFTETVGNVLLNDGIISGAGGTLVSTTGFDVRNGVIEGRLDGAVGLTKSSVGTVQLGGTNLYTGTTTVSAGALLVNGTHIGGGPYTVQAEGTLGGGGVMDSSATIHGTIAPGDGVGALTLGNSEFQAGSIFEVEVAGSLSDTLTAQDLIIDGDAWLKVTTIGEVDYGTYTIANYATRSGAFQFSAPPGFIHKYDDIEGRILLLVSIPGDFNGDGFVNAIDLSQWQLDYGLNGNSDANGDGDSDGRDFLVWQRYFNDGSLDAGVFKAVPEPTCLTLIILFVIAFGGFSRLLKRRQPRVSFLLTSYSPCLFISRFSLVSESSNALHHDLSA